MNFEVEKSSKNLKHWLCVFLAAVIAFGCMSPCASAVAGCFEEITQENGIKYGVTGDYVHSYATGGYATGGNATGGNATGGNATGGNASLTYLSFALNNDGESYSVTGCSTYASGSLTIPSTYNRKPVTNIRWYAFDGCTKLTSITIPDSVTSIGGCAFQFCTRLTSITIPDSVTSIGMSAFYNTGYYINRSNWKNGVLYIGNHLIAADISITGAYAIKTGTKTIAEFAFEGCPGLTSIAIPNSVTSIGCYAFETCTSLKHIFYGGSPRQWANISIDTSNVELKNAIIHYNATDHTYKTTTTKAALTKNGKVEIKCSICGYVSKTTVIYYPKTIKLSSTSYTCDGKVKTPSVIVEDSNGKTLVKGTDYKVSVPSGRKAIGVYKYTITFMGKYSGTKTLTFKILPAAVNTSKMTAVTATSAIRLTWPKVVGATGYKIYQYSASQGKYVQIATITDNTYKRTNLKAGTTYYFKVKAYKKFSNGTVIDGAASNTYTTATQCAATKITSAAQTTSAIRINWQKVVGATGYKVYQYNASQKKYVQIANVTGNTYKRINLKAGTTYYFKVKAYKKISNGTIIDGAVSNAFTTSTQCAAPKITSAAQTTSSIRINWSKVTGATGYKVYQYSPSKGKYVQIATVTGNTYKKTTNLKAGTTYKFIVKPYKKLSNGIIINGISSAAFATATKCAAPKITSLVASSGQKATLKWSAVTGATGYQVYYSTNNSDYKKAVSTTSKTASKTFSKSAKGKKIYFKVRAYKKVNGQTIYGNWSAVKSVTLK